MVSCDLTLLDYLHLHYLPMRPGLRSGSAEQLEISARVLSGVQLSRLDEREAAERLSEYAKTRAAATTNSRRRAILTLWRAAADDDLVLAPRARRIPKLREPHQVPRAWTVAEVSRILTACKRAGGGDLDGVRRCDFWRALVLTIYDSAARIGALLAAEPADCDLNTGWLVLRGETQKDAEGQAFPLSAETVAALAAVYAPARRALFPWPYRPEHLWRQFRKIVEAAGLSASRKRKDLFHKLRRTSLSYTARESLDLAVRKAGHCRAELTIRHYLDPRITDAGHGPARQALASLPRP